MVKMTRDCRVARDRDGARAVAHHCMFSLTNNDKTGLLQSANRVFLADARKLRHTLDRDFFMKHARAELLSDQRLRREIFGDRVAEIGERFFPGGPLRTAPWQAIAPDGPAFVRFHERDAVFHSSKVGCRRAADNYRRETRC